MRPIWSAVCVLTITFSSSLFAQEKPNYLLKKKDTNQRAKENACDCKDEKPKPKGPPPEWTYKLKVGAVLEYNNSRGVVGRLDGTSRSFSASLHGQANWERDRHNVRNRMDARGVIVKTQNTGRWVPASDYIELESIYQYRFLPYFGPFARLGMNTSMFVGRDLRTNSVQYQMPDGSLTEERTELRLSDPFKPITFLQSVGAFYNPVREENFDIDVRTGIGVREIFAGGQLGILDQSDTQGIVEVVDLKTYTEAGLEFIVMFRGELFDDTLSYFTGGEFLLPVVRSKEPGDNRKSVDLISKIYRIGVAYKLAKRATILYELRLVHQPQLIDRYQIVNNVGFKASFDLL